MNGKDDIKRQMQLHTAGATVRHSSPFKDLPSYKSGADLSAEFINEWIVPYYMTIAHNGRDWIKPDLYFDQRYVMEALLYLDKIKGSQHAEKHIHPFLNLMHAWNCPEVVPDMMYFDEQIPILKGLQVIKSL